MTTLKSVPQRHQKGEERGPDLHRDQGKFPKSMKPGLKSEGYTGGPSLGGGQAEKGACESWRKPDFWSMCWQWSASDNKGLGSHTEKLSLLPKSSGRYCRAWTRRLPFWKDLSGLFNEQIFPRNYILMFFQVRLTWLQQTALTLRSPTCLLDGSFHCLHLELVFT